MEATNRVSSLRLPLVEKINVLFNAMLLPAQLKLWTFVQKDGLWPLEENAQSAAARSTTASNRIVTEFEGAGAQSQVQLLVNFKEPVIAKKPKALPDEEVPSPPESDGSMSEFDSAVDRFNNGCVKVTGSKHRLSEHDISENLEFQRTAYSDFTATRIKRIFNGLEPTDYVQKSTPLPVKLETGIREAFQELVISSKAPWLQENEVLQRRYIDAVLTKCVVAVNTANPTKEKLLLQPEHPISCEGILAYGNADWVVARGQRMLVVIEAKQSNFQQGQYQLMAMMEAARIRNKKIDKKLDSIKSIITDFQNWMFVERSTDVLQKEELGAAIPVKKEEFPDTLIPICERVYNILLNL